MAKSSMRPRQFGRSSWVLRDDEGRKPIGSTIFARPGDARRWLRDNPEAPLMRVDGGNDE